ncbi:MAG: RdgB/HAM1 family non-canonical purine NTP pyrophosphatase [Bacilli bacterium]|nr:RdgB/HAM1 family non-canonical purine NTP pyrophosphatase [Bacilli bacterium]
MNKQIVLATHNKHKLREYREILAPLGYVIYSASDLNIDEEPEEVGTTYRENAYIKAKALRKMVKWPVIADDSGIEIKALGEHFPGVHSSRYAKSISDEYAVVGRHVIGLLKDAEDRSAEYHCCICLLEEEDSKPLYFEGICKGHILEERKGESGFGFDPIFHCDEANLDFGLCTEEEKNKVSHRAKALQRLMLYLTI